MIETSEVLFDLTGYRNIAGYVFALILLRQTQRSGLLGMKLRSLHDADWLASRLHKQGYVVVTIEPRGEQALLTIRKFD